MANKSKWIGAVGGPRMRNTTKNIAFSKMPIQKVDAPQKIAKASRPRIYDSSHEVFPNRTTAGNNRNQTTAMNFKALGGIPSYKKGGKIKNTGIAKVHKGEVILNKKQQRGVGKRNLKKALKNIYG